MIVENPQYYDLLRFEMATNGKHKYNAILQHRGTKRIKKVPFGAIKPDGTPYEQYKDRIGGYAEYDHGDRDRRKRYRQRHEGEDAKKFSSGYFSLKYLW
jgi:hypothetical protein